MKLELKPQAIEDIKYFKKNNPNIIKKIKKIHLDIVEHPFTGIGKPEPLKHSLSGMWSRRITREHRLVYKIVKDLIIIYQYRYHY